MANGADGSIRIQAVVDDEKAKKKLDQLESKMRRQTEAVRQQETRVRRLREEYERLTSGSAQPKSVKQLSAELRKAEAEAAKLDEAMQQVQNLAAIDKAARGAVSSELQSQLDATQQELAAADVKADALKRSLEEIRLNPAASDEAKKLAEDLQLATDRLERLKLEADATEGAIGEMQAGYSSKLGRIGSVFSSLGQKIRRGFTSAIAAGGTAVDNLRGGVQRLGREKGFDKAAKSAQRLQTRLRSIVSGALFFNLISAGLRQLTTTMGAMLKTNGQFVGSLSEIKSNLLTAFQPIYEAVMPMLNTLMSALSKITAQIASFISTIFGTDVSQAQKNAQALYEQANAAEAVGNAAEAAEKQLASFDTIQKLSFNAKTTAGDAQEGGSAPTFSTDFSQVKTPEWLTNFWKVFQDSWAKNGAKTIEAAKKALAGIQSALKSVGDTFMKVWTSDVGEHLLDSLYGLLQKILGLVGDIGAAFSAAWDSGVGESILTHIFEIVTGIANTAGNLAGRFQEAWNANGNGEAILSAILGIVDGILATIDRIVTATAAWAASLNLEPLLASVREVLEPLEGVIQIIGEALAEIWEEVALPFAQWVIEEAVPTIMGWLGDFFNFLIEHKETVKAFIEVLVALWAAYKAYTIVSTVIGVFKNLLSTLTPLKVVLGLLIPLIAGVLSAWSDMSTLERVVSVLGLLVTAAAAAAIAVGALQSAWSLGIAAAAIVGGVALIASQINSATKRASTTASTQSTSGYSTYSAASIPALANGAVISPNNEFLAILGDQKHGVNIETPLSTMKQAFLEAMQESGSAATGNVNVRFTGSLSQLARVLTPQIEIEQNRAGTRLVKGGSY